MHFSFIDISPEYETYVNKSLTAQFERFKKMSGIKRVIEFGGWKASTHPSTYWIFRDGVKAAKRLKLATKLLAFLEKHGLDGVDIDWEYPAAPYLPKILEGDPANGPDYLAFLTMMKRRLASGKTLSIAAPASYWYLKGFPIKDIAKVIAYIVYMIYDLHVWDNNWIAYMDRTNKNNRESKYRGLNYGGTTHWAIDLESFSPFDMGHPGIFFQIPDEDEDFAVLDECRIITWSPEAQEHTKGEVSRFLAQKLGDGLENWADLIWEAAGHPGGSGCHSISGGQCTWSNECVKGQVRNYWSIKKISNAMSTARLIKGATNAAFTNNTYYKDAIHKALSMNGREPADSASAISLLVNFGNSFGVLGGALSPSNPVTGAFLGTAGAFLGLIKDKFAEGEQQFQDLLNP
ncbi:uncharacterized protein J7T54_002723 [Emericellopsis cladophorae]|uniref:chitinase n=1 Tax=Emericellopsis cladophorae TaxID=2686198 RepID=A0A9P9XV53_9HYPO|nr:uncharacterized protein J7T54_002723 [Emericellopsis cladophorae]KAI6778188.1 hypothetical protein J7T54_002723 [Emericellopsis cladophorae]